MNRIIFIKKESFESLSSHIQYEFRTNANLLGENIPTHVLSGEDWYAFEFSKNLLDTSYVKFYQMYSEKEAADIIASGNINQSPKDTYFPQNQAFKSNVLPDGRKLVEHVYGVKKACIIGANDIYFIAPFNCKFNEIEFVNSLIGEEADVYIRNSQDVLKKHYIVSVNLPAGQYKKVGQYGEDLVVGDKIHISYNIAAIAVKRVNITLHRVVN